MERDGNWIQTFTGRKYWPIDPRIEDVDIIDIAWALSGIRRFGGHAAPHYNVADHSIRVADLLYKYSDDLSSGMRNKVALTGLLHDAAEAYLGDWVRPIKHLQEFRPLYDKYATMNDEVIGSKFVLLDISTSSRIKEADNILLATEKRDLMYSMEDRPDIDWESLSNKPKLLSECILPLSSEHAFARFLQRFAMYSGEIC